MQLRKVIPVAQISLLLKGLARRCNLQKYKLYPLEESDAMPSQPFNYNLLLFVTEKLLGFMSNRRGFATFQFQVIGDGGGRNVKLFCSITK